MLHLGTIGKTSIDIDPSFFFLALIFVVFEYDPRQGMHYALLWVPVLFISILLHELAHAGAITLLGHGPSHVILGGMGGVTIAQRRSKPWQDLIISVVGPLANFAVAIAATWIMTNVEYVATDKALLAFLPHLWRANIAWGILNLVPVPPLDGGHAVRGFFRTVVSERLAFVISIWIAMIVGVLIVAAAFYIKQFFLAFFIAMYAFRCWQQWQEYRERGVIGD